MDNPVVQTDIAEVLGQINQKLDGISVRLGKLEVGQAEIKGDIKAIDEKFSGQIKTLDEKVSGKTGANDTKTDQLEKRISNKRVFQPYYWWKPSCQYIKRYSWLFLDGK